MRIRHYRNYIYGNSADQNLESGTPSQTLQEAAREPTKQDLEAVATQLLAQGWNDEDQAWNSLGSDVPADFVHMIVGYALTCKMRLPAVADTIHEARYQARQNGRQVVAGVDIQKALLDYRIPTDGALQQAFAPRPRSPSLNGQMR